MAVPRLLSALFELVRKLFCELDDRIGCSRPLPAGSQKTRSYRIDSQLNHSTRNMPKWGSVTVISSVIMFFAGDWGTYKLQLLMRPTSRKTSSSARNSTKCDVLPGKFYIFNHGDSDWTVICNTTHFDSDGSRIRNLGKL